MVAAFGNLQVCASREVEKPVALIAFGIRVRILGNKKLRLPAALQMLHKVRDLCQVPVSENAVRFGKLLGKLLAVALGKATRDNDLRLGIEVPELEERVDRFLACAFNEAAGVHKDQIRLCGIVREDPSVGGEDLRHYLRIDLVFGATEIFYI